MRYKFMTVAILAMVAILVSLSSSVSLVRAGAMQTYVVLYKDHGGSADAASTIANAGGTLVYAYDVIGVVIARSENAAFRSNLLKDSRVENAAATTNFGVRLEEEEITFVSAAELSALAQKNAVVGFDDPLSSLQWDMIQIHVPEAHQITRGSSSVVVGDLDTGLDYTHPDLAANIDFGKSVSCESGAPDQNPAAWYDHNGHGTHTAGTIAAAANGIGIIGVAPNVKIAGIKTSNDDGYFFPEMVICAFVWAAENDIDITNNSYFADPWLFNCHNDAEQRAIWKAEQRAIRYAMQQGVTVVAAEGNQNMDLSKRNIDTVSPDFPPGSEVTREITNACVVIPVEIAGVIGVTANGNLRQKSYYSSYGVGTAQVVAPGGDTRFQRTPQALNGVVLSTFPGGYGYAQGTSMASPHVAGVAALVMSRYGQIPPGSVQAIINRTADAQPCPPNPFNPGPPFNWPATCAGGTGYNGFYGHGQVNAWRAIK
jgi:subtilisin family serine protease